MAENIRSEAMDNMPKKCTIYVKNVQRKLCQFGFKGKIVIKKKMVPYDKAAWQNRGIGGILPEKNRG